MTLAGCVLAVAIAVAACTGQSEPDGPAIPTCEVRFAAPSGFAPGETFEQPYDDRIGVRLGFLDDQGREFHVFAGIPGEFGEGLPEGGEMQLADGATGSVLGRRQVWVVRWDEGDVCDPRAVLVNGVDRDGFEALLLDAGLVAGS